MIARKETLEDILSVLDQLFEEGRADRVASEVARAVSLFPESLTLLEWQAVLAIDHGDFREALRCLHEVTRREPGRRFAMREKASVLQELGRFDDALEILLALGPEGERDAAYHYHLASCLDRDGRRSEADADFERAHRLAPDEFSLPARRSRRAFRALIRQAVATLPERFSRPLETVRVEIEDYPLPTDPDPFLLGLYFGSARRARNEGAFGPGDAIVIYKRNLELECPDVGSLVSEIAKTIQHEILQQLGLPADEVESLE